MCVDCFSLKVSVGKYLRGRLHFSRVFVAVGMAWPNHLAALAMRISVS